MHPNNPAFLRIRGKLPTMKTRTLLILAAVTGLAIIVAFALQVVVDGRFLG